MFEHCSNTEGSGAVDASLTGEKFGQVEINFLTNVSLSDACIDYVMFVYDPCQSYFNKLNQLLHEM